MTGRREALRVVRRRADRHGRERDPQNAALGHRIARVDHQVQQHLLDLPAIAAHGRQVGRGGRGHLHVFADDAAQHLLGGEDELIERH